MDFILSPIEVRVLGSLVEKELTTPEYCPLTLNSLVLACNQKSNRDPITSLSEEEVSLALETLRSRQLAWQRSTPGSRVAKFEHNLAARFGFSQMEMAVVCVLMLRGFCTPGEIRSCTGRMYQFKDLAEVEAVLQNLTVKEHGPFVARLALQPGKKEARFAHLFSGEVAVPAEASVAGPEKGNGIAPASSVHDRLAGLEERVACLTDELAALRQEFVNFKKAFE